MFKACGLYEDSLWFSRRFSADIAFLFVCFASPQFFSSLFARVFQNYLNRLFTVFKGVFSGFSILSTYKITIKSFFKHIKY